MRTAILQVAASAAGHSLSRSLWAVTTAWSLPRPLHSLPRTPTMWSVLGLNMGTRAMPTRSPPSLAPSEGRAVLQINTNPGLRFARTSTKRQPTSHCRRWTVTCRPSSGSLRRLRVRRRRSTASCHRKPQAVLSESEADKTSFLQESPVPGGELHVRQNGCCRGPDRPQHIAGSAPLGGPVAFAVGGATRDLPMGSLSDLCVFHFG